MPDQKLQQLWVIEITTSSSHAPICEEFLTSQGVPFSLIHNPEKEVAVSRIYCLSEKEAEIMSNNLTNELENWRPLLPTPRLEVLKRPLQKEAWSESWKRHFHTFKASRRLVIKPSWEEYQGNSDEIVLSLDPGMCFGTGYHGTTQACLQFLDEIAEDIGVSPPFLDAGCGSGILSLAALKLGFSPVYAFDNDPDAIAVTRNHLKAWTEQDITVEIADLQNCKPAMKFPVVAANILAPVLKENVDTLISFLDRTAPKPFLILSGILSEQYEGVKEVFEQGGVQEIKTRTIDKWKSGCFTTVHR
ncbi:MAG: 50S ribosomal protein L11 methyltransferase [Lentisphaeria bacterium]